MWTRGFEGWESWLDSRASFWHGFWSTLSKACICYGRNWRVYNGERSTGDNCIAQGAYISLNALHIFGLRVWYYTDLTLRTKAAGRALLFLRLQYATADVSGRISRTLLNISAIILEVLLHVLRKYVPRHGLRASKIPDSVREMTFVCWRSAYVPKGHMSFGSLWGVSICLIPSFYVY